MSKFKYDIAFKAVVIGGSAGSFQGITRMLSEIPDDFEIPIIMCLHRLKHVRNGFVEALSLKSIRPVVEPYDKEPIKKNKIYLAPSNYHMSVELGNTFSLSTEDMINNSRPAIDVTLSTAAYVYKSKCVGILLSGANKDGALGMKRIKDRGGVTIIQDPSECMIATMPEAAMAITEIDHVLDVQNIISYLKGLNKYLKGIKV